MKIFREGNRIRLQLKDMQRGTMMIDCSIEDTNYEQLRQHMIKVLEENPLDKLQ